jgi:hypothetical protein
MSHRTSPCIQSRITPHCVAPRLPPHTLITTHAHAQTTRRTTLHHYKTQARGQVADLGVQLSQRAEEVARLRRGGAEAEVAAGLAQRELQDRISALQRDLIK